MSSRKDYVAMADILKRHREKFSGSDPDSVVQLEIDNLTRRIADHFAYDSAAFSYPQFYEAAGMKVR